MLCLQPVPEDGGAWELPLRAAATTVHTLDLDLSHTRPNGLACVLAALPRLAVAGRRLRLRDVPPSGWDTLLCSLVPAIPKLESGPFPVGGGPPASLTWEQRLSWTWGELEQPPTDAVAEPLGNAFHLQHCVLRLLCNTLVQRSDVTSWRLFSAMLGAPRVRALEVYLDGSQHAQASSSRSSLQN